MSILRRSGRVILTTMILFGLTAWTRHVWVELHRPSRPDPAPAVEADEEIGHLPPRGSVQFHLIPRR